MSEDPGMKNLFSLLFLLLGCSPSLTNQTLNPAVVDAVDASVKAIAAIYEAEQQACIGTPTESVCISNVRDRWVSTRAAILATQAAVHAASGAK